MPVMLRGTTMFFDMKRILVIVDDLLMIHVIELIIQKEGYDADLAYNGKEATLLLRMYDYDLALQTLSCHSRTCRNWRKRCAINGRRSLSPSWQLSPQHS